VDENLHLASGIRATSVYWTQLNYH